MEFQLCLAFAIISMGMLLAHGAESPEEAYWKTNVGNDISMPNIVKESLPGSKNLHTILLHCGIQMGVYEPRISPHNVKGSKLPTYNSVQFFLEENLINPGSKMRLKFMMGATEPKFKSTKQANSLPFTSKKLPQILQAFAINPQSKTANLIDETLWFCEHKPADGEHKFCAKSLESMVSYAKSRLGDQVNVLSTQAETETVKEYVISNAEKIKTESNLACHKMVYPFAVFYCHSFSNTDVYQVGLIDGSGKKVRAIAVCHKDTSPWYPGHVAFKLLKVKPGTVPICHFLHPNALIWVTK